MSDRPSPDRPSPDRATPHPAPALADDPNLATPATPGSGREANPASRFQAPVAALTEAEMIPLIGQLRRKEGSWVEWGKACQELQRSGLSPQQIFEETGFEPIQQNQIIVAAQVYRNLEKGQAIGSLLEHFGHRGSDVLYELRILSERDRLAAADLCLSLRLDCDEAKDLAKAMKEFSQASAIPEDFTVAPGDALAWQAWRTARQTADLQERSRLIARGLRFAQTTTARGQLEKLLLDFTIAPTKTAPRLPLYRIDSDEEEPRLLAVAGQLPLPVEDFKAVPLITGEGPFGLVKFAGAGAWVAVPNWQVLRQAEDPIALLCHPDHLPAPLPDDRQQEVLVIIDRAKRDWDEGSYAAIDQDGNLALTWLSSEPKFSILGRLILVLRPKRVIDEAYSKEWWQLDE